MLSVFLLFISSHGVELRLKNGTLRRGTITAEDAATYTITADNEKMKIAKSSIAAIDGRPYSAVFPQPKQPAVQPLKPAPDKKLPSKIRAEQPGAETGKGTWSVLLKNGSVLKGKPISENQRILVLESKGSPVTIFKNVIFTIDSSGGKATAPIVAAAAPVKTTPSPRAIPAGSKSSGKTSTTVPTPVAVTATGQSTRRTVVPPATMSSSSENRRATSPAAVPPAAAASASPPVLPKPLQVKVATMRTDAAGEQASDNLPESNPAASGGNPSPAQEAPGGLPEPKSRVNVVELTAESSVAGDAVPQTGASEISGTPEPVATAVPSRSGTAATAPSENISIIPAPRTPGRGVSRKFGTPAPRPPLPAAAVPSPVPPLTAVGTAVSSTVNSGTITAAAPPQARNSPLPAPKQSDSEKESPTLPSPVSPDAAAPGTPVSPSAAASVKTGGSAGTQVRNVPPLSMVTPPPVQPPNSRPLPVEPTTAQKRNKSPLAPEPVTSPVPPMDRSTVPKIHKARNDGKKELVMMDSTIFIGTVVSETDHVIVFLVDGASLTILKRLVRTIDGKPCTVAKNDKNIPPSTPPQPAGPDKNVTKKIPPHILFRILPADSLPEGISTEQLADSMRYMPDWRVRSRAARYAGEMGPWGGALVPDVAKLLADTAQVTEPIPDWIDSTSVKVLLAPALEAARTLAQLGGQGEAELLAAYRHPDPIMRRNAVFGLGNCFLESADKVVKSALKDADPRVRKVALGSLRANFSFTLLVGALKDADPGVRASAAILLGKLGNREAVDRLAELVRDGNPEVRRMIASALGTIGESEVVAPLTVLAKDADHFVRADAVRVLGQTRQGNAVEPLLDALKDPAGDVRAGAVAALGILRDSRSIPALYAALKDKDPTVRANAEAALKNHTDLPLLVAALDDESTAVRANAAYVLWLMTGQDLGRDRRKWEEWMAAGRGKPGSKK